MKEKQRKYIERHKKYQKYANKELDAGRKPIKFKDYGIEDTYFKGMSKQTPESRLKAAGINWEKDKPSAKLKRKK